MELMLALLNLGTFLAMSFILGMLVLLAFRAIRIILLRSAAALLGMIAAILRWLAPATAASRPTL